MMTDSDRPASPDTADSTGPPPGRVRAVVIAVSIIVVDQLTKWWAVSRLETGACRPETCIDVGGTPLRFHLHYNTGASFSRGEGFGPVIAVIAVLMAGYLLWLAGRTANRFHQILFGIIAGGAVGNLLDRVFRADDGPLSGGVVDFIDFQFWPIFNIADMAIVLGVLVLLLDQIRIGRSGDEDRASVEPASDA